MGKGWFEVFAVVAAVAVAASCGEPSPPTPREIKVPCGRVVVSATFASYTGPYLLTRRWEPGDEQTKTYELSDPTDPSVTRYVIKVCSP